MSRPRPFDPRTLLSAQIHDLGPIQVWRKDPKGGGLLPHDERKLAMSVFLDGEERIHRGLMITGEDELVAFSECSVCELFECNLTEGYAALVRRLGPYVLWITPWGDVYAFDEARYREVFGAGVDALPPLGPEEMWDLDEVPSSGEYVTLDGRRVSFDVDRDPDSPLGALQAWPVRLVPDIEVVLPPASALEVRSTVPDAPSLWIDDAPRADGRLAGYFPGIVRAPVWIAGLEVDRAIDELLGPDAPHRSRAGGSRS